MKVPLIIAHRGDSSSALENSLEAFQLAFAVPANMVEADVRMSRDGVLYIMHDRDTGRTADRSIDLEQALSGEIDRVRLRNGEPVPRLDELLELASGKAGVNIEIKSDGAAYVLARLLSERPYSGTLMVSSFKEMEVSSLRESMPGIRAALIYDTFSVRHVADYQSKGFDRISLRKNTVTEQLVRACRDRGIQVFVWTVDEEAEMQQCIEWGVDGIYTNRPRVLRDVIGKHGKPEAG